MADDLKRSERTVAPEVRQDRSLARVQAVPWLIVIVLLAAVAWLGWRAFFYQEEGDPVGSETWGTRRVRRTTSRMSLRGIPEQS